LIRRAPIFSVIDKALNFITAGKLEEAKRKYNYDKLFHLSMVVAIKMEDTGIEKRFLVEKNEVINITDAFKSDGSEEYMRVPVPCCITFREMMDKAQQSQGIDFFKYDAFRNNCQVFLMTILRANGLMTPQIQAFILQDVGSILKELPAHTSPFANLTTNLAAVADRVLQGNGLTISRMRMLNETPYEPPTRPEPSAFLKTMRIDDLRKQIQAFSDTPNMAVARREHEIGMMEPRYIGTEESHRQQLQRLKQRDVAMGQAFDPHDREPNLPVLLAPDKSGVMRPVGYKKLEQEHAAAERMRELRNPTGRGKCCGGCSSPNHGDCGMNGGCGMCGGAVAMVKMTKKAYMAEHKRLLRVLDKITKQAKAEAAKQRAEPAMKGGKLSEEQKKKLSEDTQCVQS